MRDRRWVALPAGSTLALVVLLVLRVRVVQRRTGDWSGEDCVVGPYDPAERTYLYAITGVLVLALVSAVMVAICVGGLEYNNRPDPSMPCPFLNKDLHL